MPHRSGRAADAMGGPAALAASGEILLDGKTGLRIGTAIERGGIGIAVIGGFKSAASI
jgi:hypothetical protein